MLISIKYPLIILPIAISINPSVSGCLVSSLMCSYPQIFLHSSITSWKTVFEELCDFVTKFCDFRLKVMKPHRLLPEGIEANDVINTQKQCFLVRQLKDYRTRLCCKCRVLDLKRRFRKILTFGNLKIILFSNFDSLFHKMHHANFFQVLLSWVPLQWASSKFLQL